METPTPPLSPKAYRRLMAGAVCALALGTIASINDWNLTRAFNLDGRQTVTTTPPVSVNVALSHISATPSP